MWVAEGGVVEGGHFGSWYVNLPGSWLLLLLLISGTQENIAICNASQFRTPSYWALLITKRKRREMRWRYHSVKKKEKKRERNSLGPSFGGRELSLGKVYLAFVWRCQLDMALLL